MVRPHHFIHLSGIVAIAAIASSAVFAYVDVSTQAATVVPKDVAVETAAPAEPETVVPVESGIVIEAPRPTKLGWPISNALDRVTKKTFALEVHPETSPVPNDRFNGFHVGVDFEVSEDEMEIDVPVFAACDGKLLIKQFAKGYGGYALQSCMIDDEPVTVIYGHLNLASIQASTTQTLARGDRIGVLGRDHSPETDGVRKHLHFGIHRGTDVDIRGYVQETEEIGNWIDALPLLR